MYRAFKLAAALLAAAATLAPTAASAQYHDRSYDMPARARAYDHRSYRGQSASYRDVYRCNKGTGGTLLGAIAGGLLGDAAVGRRGDRTAGVLAGAGVGALLGRAADRDC